MTKPPLNYENISRLYAALTMDPKGLAKMVSFDMGFVQRGPVTPEHPCGTACCAMGLTPMIFDGVTVAHYGAYRRWVEVSPGDDWSEAAMKLFGMTEREVDRAFVSFQYSKPDAEITPADVAKRLVEIVLEREKEESK